MARWIAVLLLAAGVVLQVACEEETAKTAKSLGGASTYSEDDPEYKLASIDAGEPLSPDDPSIGAYARVLDRLDGKCQEPRSRIGDYAVTARRLLGEAGIEVTVLDALRGIDGSIPEDIPELKCDEITAAWVTLQIGQ